MSLIKRLRTSVAEWNNMFPLDYWWRKKHNITFNSPEHRAANQIDIYIEWLEEKLYEEFQDQSKKEEEDKKLYEKGVILKERKETDEFEDEDLFNKLDVRAINNKSTNLKIDEE